MSETSPDEDTMTLEEQAQFFFQTLDKAFQPLSQAFQQAATTIAEAFEDALRDNAYHPTGTVIRSTAVVLPDEQKLLEAPDERTEA